MKAFALVALVIIGFAVPILATQMFTSNILEELKQKHQNSEFGQYFFEMMELKARQGSNTEYIVTLVKSIVDKLINEQAAEDNEHSQRMTQFDATISGLEKTVDAVSFEIQTTNRVVGDLSADIAAIAQTIASSTRQINLLNSRIQILTDERAQAHANYEQNVQLTNRILGAVDQVLSYLSQAVLDQQGQVLLQTKKESIVNKIKAELGATHPIAIMVEMTSEFNEATARRVIEKLENIRSSLEESLRKAEVRENSDQLAFQTIVGSLTDVRERLSVDLQQSTNAMTTKQNDLVVAQRRSNELTEELSINQELLVSNRNQRASYDANYSTRRTSRGEEITIVSGVYDLLNQNAEKMQQQITPQ